jgi:hypothetical protein
MDIKKGTKLLVKHSRKGKFVGIAKKDFNKTEEWYPIVAAEEVSGRTQIWNAGEEVPCRGSMCSVSILEE